MMLLGALACAHAAGIVHRDVKPGNVLLTRDGRAVLTDFGIAAVDGDPALTQTGMVVGTPGFCAPERIRGAPASPASDLWSLGATLYAAVEGRGPFDGHGSPMEVLTSIVHSDPPLARSAGPLEAVIGALMSKDPAQRPDAARARELLTDAAAALGAVPGAAGAPPAGLGPAAACAEPAFATAGPASASTAPAFATAGPASASTAPALAAGPARTSAGADPVPPWTPASDGPSGPSAKTDPTGFPASDRATAVAGPGLAALPPGAGPGGFLAGPSSKPFTGGTGTAQFPASPDASPIGSRPGPFPASPRLGLFPAAAGPALIPVGTSLAGPAAGLAPLPVSMGAAPFPPGTGVGGGPAGRPAARPPAGRRLLVLGLAGAAVVLAGLVWWLVAGPPAHGRASGTGGGAGGRAATAAGPLPAGYRWYSRAARAAGTPGFTMAAPVGWQAHRRGAATFLRNPVSGGIIGVTLTPPAAVGPVREALMLERAALARGTFTGYRRIAITPFLVRGRLAGAWRFSYRPPGGGVMEALVVVTQVTAPGGHRPYELMAAAPAVSWPRTMSALAEAARTFSPGP
jgi:hypothetical protein